MKKSFALFSVFMLIIVFSCLNEIPEESATIVIANTGMYNIDTVRIFESTNYDRSKDNLLKSGEMIQNYPPNDVKSFTVMASISYYIEVHYTYMTDSYKMIHTDVLSKDQVLNTSFYYP